MFGDKKAAATADRLARVSSLLTVAGIAEGAELPTPEAFRAQLENGRNAAITEATAPLQTALDAAKSENTAFRAALAAAGIVFAGEQNAGAIQLAEGETLAGKVTAAIQTAVSTAATKSAAKQVAASGHPNAIEVPSDKQAGNNGDASAETPASAEEFMKAHAAITDPAKKTEYFRKHAHRFPVR